MGSSTGCRWTGDHSPPAAALEPPPASTATAGAYQSRSAAPDDPPSHGAPGLVTGATPVVFGNGPASAAPPAAVAAPATGGTSGSASGLLLTSAPGDAVAEANKEEVLAGAVQARGLAQPADLPDADKMTKEEKERKAKIRKLLGNEPIYQVNRTLPSPSAGMETPSLPTPEKVQPISLAGALAQAGVENPVIAIANQAIQVSRAQLLQARALLLPNLNVGSSYDLHNGPLQGSIGVIRKVDRQAVYYGMGAYAVAPGTVQIPGLFIDVALADALYEPQIARQVVANRRFTWAATRNQVLLEVSTAYLALLGAEGRLAVIRQSEADFREVARLTAMFAKPGILLGRDADARRAEADLRQLQFQEQRVQEDIAVAAADLAHLLNLDPSTRLQTGDVPIQVVQFVDPKESLPNLLDIAARNRPELMAAAATIRASQKRVRQETVRPLIPYLWAGFSAGDFGGGAVAIQNPVVANPATLTDGAGQPNGHTTPVFGSIASRTDVDVMAFWTLQNFGLGNLAHVKQRRAQLGEAQAARQGVQNQVNLEVTEAYARSAQNYRSIEIERRNVQEASDAFQRDLERIIGGVGLPIEVLDSAERLSAGRQKLLDAVIGFDRAQFQLFVALGQPPTLVVDDDKPTPPPPPFAPAQANAPQQLPPPNLVPPEKK
jgi:outer membrane protein TolC